MSKSTTSRRLFHTGLISLAATALTACGGESSPLPAAMQLPVPDPLRQIAQLDSTALSLEVSINNNTPLVFPSQGSIDSWRISIDVPASQTNTIKVTWIENFEQERLVLAEQSSTIDTGETASTFNLSYNYKTDGSGFDYDSDGVSNLAERQGATNPLIHDSGQFIVNEPETVYITAGCFTMGSPATELGRTSQEIEHDVCVDNYRIGKYEVTFEQYDQFAAATNRFKPNDFDWGRGAFPVIDVNWYDATDYAAWLAAQTGKPYRLLTEAEWEYAARAGSTTPFHTGNTIAAEQANYNARVSYDGGAAGAQSTQSVAVGSYPANAWGIHDMHGNQAEWTCSTFAVLYDGGELTCNSIAGNPTYSIRGGAWNSAPNKIRSAARFRETPDRSYFYVGLRIAIGE